MSTTAESALLSFAEQAAAFATAQGLAPLETPPLDGTPMRAREQLVRWHGPADDGFGDWVYPGRTVIEVPGWTWPAARPEDCQDEPFHGNWSLWFDAEGRWIPSPGTPDAAEGIVLLCAGCGLDCT